MTITRRSALLAGASLLAASALARSAAAFEGSFTDMLAGTEDFGVAVDAYVFGYSLVTMEYTRRIMTNVAAAEETRAPMGTLLKVRSYPDATYRDVTAPNADTLYTTAWLDVGDEPWVLHQPDMGDRYFLLPMLDGWTEVFAVPGSRTTGGGAKTFLITGPGWSGTVPDGMTQVKSPTSIVWLLGRIYCTGTKEDYAAVHALQDAFKLQPLSTWGSDFTPPAGTVDPSVDMKTPTRDQVNALTSTEFFTVLADLMKRNPPTAADAPEVARFAAIGLEPGKDLDASRISAVWDKLMPEFGYKKIMLHFISRDGDMKRENGWAFTTVAGNYGTNYIQRALVTAIGLGANKAQDAIYPTSLKPSLLESYDGAKNYTLTFAKGQLPPVKGFWSLTMYDEQMFFVANPINRYSMSLRTNPTYETDGSLVIHIQNTSPGPDKEANWLPAPTGKFHLMLRLYWPDENKPSIIDGSWTIPGVVKA
ncbi:DUF1254 domain-containing protein [Palleronia sp. KMU-117]|uniref:DUF1254 domain-containing protein n=1 Tax=Palleronia sp. KMU-117 TaxID=3434108 RepID=UPI003D70C7CA